MQLKGSTIAITGATGFLGGYLVARLRARGAHIVAVVRNPDKAESLRRQGCEIKRADLSEPGALAAAFRGADAVISNAGVISFRNPEETMRTNAEGTQNVFHAIVEAGVKRAIAVSSTAAYPTAIFELDERTPLRIGKRLGRLDAYGESKAKGERIAWEIADKHGVALTTFRPCGITAAGDPLLMRTLERVFSLPIAPYPALTTVGVVHAEDVAEAVALALEKPDVAIGKAYNLQGVTATLWEIGSAWKRAGGRAPWLRVPIPVPYALRFSDQRARRELGWSPRDLESIVCEAVALRCAP